MLAELVHHVIGVDPDRDWITLAVVDAPNESSLCQVAVAMVVGARLFDRARRLS